MAGAGYKLFNTGDVLTAAQVNTYLMEQTVMVFADSAARTSALSGVLAEGMVSYLQDNNVLEVYNGSAWVGATGDITGLTAGTGITITNDTGPVPTITNDIATEFDAKGDLVVGTGADAFDKLSVGSNGDTLLADSSQSTGLRYNPPVGSLAQPVINGGMDVWQRGTTLTPGGVNNAFGADRWQAYRAVGGLTVSRQTTGDTTNLPNIQYASRIQRDSSNNSTSEILYFQNFETVNSIPFAGKTVTLSYYARAGANFSSASSALTIQVQTGTGTDQNFVITGYTGNATPLNTTSTLTTTWQRFAHTFTIAATATEISQLFRFTPVGTAGANDWFEVTGVQIDLGTYTKDTAPTFRRSGGTLQGELAACQRYYIRTKSDQLSSNYGLGFGNSATQTYFQVNIPEMRTSPTVLDYANLEASDGSAAVAFTNLTINAGNTTARVAFIIGTHSSGVTQYRPYLLRNNNNTAGYLGLGAEL